MEKKMASRGGWRRRGSKVSSKSGTVVCTGITVKMIMGVVRINTRFFINGITFSIYLAIPGPEDFFDWVNDLVKAPLRANLCFGRSVGGCGVPPISIAAVRKSGC